MPEPRLPLQPRPAASLPHRPLPDLVLPLEELPGVDARDELHQGPEAVHLHDPGPRPQCSVPAGGPVRPARGRGHPPAAGHQRARPPPQTGGQGPGSLPDPQPDILHLLSARLPASQDIPRGPVPSDRSLLPQHLRPGPEVPDEGQHRDVHVPRQGVLQPPVRSEQSEQTGQVREAATDQL